MITWKQYGKAEFEYNEFMATVGTVINLYYEGFHPEEYNAVMEVLDQWFDIENQEEAGGFELSAFMRRVWSLSLMVEDEVNQRLIDNQILKVVHAMTSLLEASGGRGQ